jgi:hypothetical protein
VKQVLEITQETFETKYVGLPTPEGRINKGKFQSLQAKMLREWGENYLPQGGKEVMLKVVLSVLFVPRVILNYRLDCVKTSLSSSKISW